MLNTFTLASLLAQLFLAALSSEETCTVGADPGKCADTHCDVQIGDQKYCSQCVGAGYGPINGKCSNNLDSNTCDKGVCKSCTTGYFLHEGGCYKKGEKPGSLICKDATGSTVGVCDECQAGYFKNPSATAATHQSCIACNRTAAVDSVKGVEGCTACTAEGLTANAGGTAKCTECTGDKIVKTADGATSCVTEDQCKGTEGFFVKTNDSTKTCEACGDENCATCAATSKNQCSKCKATNTAGAKLYLKTASSGSTGTCVTEADCTNGNYIDEAAKTCSTCASAGTTGCKTCAKKDGVVACASCEDSQKFGLNKKSCVKDCPANSQAGSDSVCVCNDGFTPSTDSTACVAASSDPNLSAGAIAGISVAAVVVVGGLVGFLCWWFVCRGKA